jgi:hypothetical protein
MAGNSTERDSNFTPVYSGEGDNGLTLPWSIDSVTGRVLMDITIVNDYTPSAPVNRALKDANFRDTLTGVSDADNKTPLSAAIDASTGLLVVDLVIE